MVFFLHRRPVTVTVHCTNLQRQEAGGDAVRLLGESAGVQGTDHHLSLLLHQPERRRSGRVQLVLHCLDLTEYLRGDAADLRDKVTVKRDVRFDLAMLFLFRRVKVQAFLYAGVETI